MQNPDRFHYRTPERTIDQLVEHEQSYWNNFLLQEAIIPPLPPEFTDEHLKSYAAFGLTVVSLPQLLEPNILSKAVLPTLHKRYPVFIHQDKSIDFRKLDPDCMRMLPAQTVPYITWSPHTYQSDTYEIDFAGTYCGGWYAVETIAQPRLPYEAYQITQLQKTLKLPPKRTGLPYYKIQHILNESPLPFLVRLPRIDELNLLAMRFGLGNSNILEFTSADIHVAGNGLQFPVNYVPVMGLGPEFDRNERKTGTGYTRAAHKHIPSHQIGYRLVVPLNPKEQQTYQQELLKRQLDNNS